MKGQGLVEYALILILVAVCVIVMLAVFAPLVNNPCFNSGSFACKQARVQECMQSEAFTKEQCVFLMGDSE
jgi:hypothetical protein